MLQDLRKSTQGTTAKVVVGLIVVTFALFGVESIVGGMGGEPEVAEVNGEAIVESEYARAVEGKRRQILAQMGEFADADLIDDNLLRSSVLEGLIEEKVLIQDAIRKDLFVADQAIDNYIRSAEHFKIDGAFSNERMQTLLRNAGLTLQGYRESLRKEFIVAQPRSALIASSFVLGAERDEIVSLDRQTRSFGSLVVLKSEYLESIVVSDDEVRAYYDANQADFVKPKSADVSFVEIDKIKLAAAVDVTEEEIRALYDSEKQEYEGEEQREAAHILLKINDERTDEQALAEINVLRDQLLAGAEFSTLAKEKSEDDGSASEGGSLGLAGRGVYVADFEDALYSLKEGGLSAPVKTEFGYHLIKLEKIEASDVPSFDEVKLTLAERLRDQKSSEEYSVLAERLADISYASSDLREPSEELELEYMQLAGVSSETQDPVFSNLKVQRVLFSDEIVKEQNNSEFIELEDGRGLVFHVDTMYPEGIRTYEEVAAQVRVLLSEEKTAEFAESVGQAFIARVMAGEGPEPVAEDMGLKWSTHKGISRNDVELDRELVARVFSAKKFEANDGDVFGYKSLSGNFAVVSLNKILSGESSELPEADLVSINRLIGDGFGAISYRNYKQVLAASAEVTRI